MADKHQPVTTDTCTVLAIANGTARVRFGYSDKTAFETEMSVPFGERDAIEAAIRSSVAGPKGEEKRIVFSWPDEKGGK